MTKQEALRKCDELAELMVTATFSGELDLMAVREDVLTIKNAFARAAPGPCIHCALSDSENWPCQWYGERRDGTTGCTCKAE